MSWSRIQSASKAATSSAVSSVALAYGTNLTSGTKLIVAVATSTQTGTTTTVSTVKDGAGNSLTLVGRKSAGTSPVLTDVSLWAMDTPSADAGTKPTITATLTGGTANMSILLQEVSGLAVGNTTAAMIDGTLAGLTGSATGTTGSPSYTSAAVDEYLVSVYGDDGGPISAVKPSALTSDANSLNSQTYANCALAYGNSTDGAEAGSWTLTGSAAEWATLLVAFQLPGSSLAVTTTSLPGATIGVPYSQTLAAAGGAPPYTWSVSAGSLPAWATLNASTGVISGTPAGGEAGTADFTAKVTDSAGSGATLTITTTSLPDATAGDAYSETLAATGGTTPYTWSVSSGSLPAWASLGGSTGILSGTPTSLETGTTDFTAKVTDAVSATDTQPLAVTVDSSSSQPSGPSGTWTLAWNDEFNDAEGMSGHTNGLALSKWNVGFYYGPSEPGGTGYDGLSYTASSGGGAIEFYGPKALSFPSDGGMVMSCYASGAGPDGASYSAGGHSSTSESSAIMTHGIMNITPNTGYSVPSDIAATVIQAANICVEIECQFPGDDYIAGDNTVLAGGYWAWIGTYNCGDCTTPDYPNSGTWTEEIDHWESFGEDGSDGSDYFLTFHAASAYGSIVSAPSSLASTDLSLAIHKYTVKYTYSTIELWVDGVQVTGISPTAAEVEAQWATPQYLGLAFQLTEGYIATGASSAGHTGTPWTVNYVRVFTQ